MTHDSLAVRLRALTLELNRLPGLDAETRHAADRFASELERLGVGMPGARPTAGSLEALAVRFEAEHPALAAALRQGADLLGKAGI